MICPNGKVRYETRYEARTSLLAMWKRSHGKRSERSTYRCRECGGWHLTSKKRRIP